MEQPSRELAGFQTDPHHPGRMLYNDSVNAFGGRAALASPDCRSGIVDDADRSLLERYIEPDALLLHCCAPVRYDEALMLQAPASAITGCPDLPAGRAPSTAAVKDGPRETRRHRHSRRVLDSPEHSAKLICQRRQYRPPRRGYRPAKNP
jgi:hypothetical protein